MGLSDTLTFRGYGNEEKSVKEPEKEQPEKEEEKSKYSVLEIKSKMFP